ncbi:hypothetical protein [Nocardia sp. NPDC057440]|uniref:hypothetical protein n=1 Tax=Nocardia sp. NPDC057440 TaxID=3346134 RepID=UPI00366D57E0
MTAVDSAGTLWPVVLRLGEPSVARVELVGQGVFGSDDDDYLSCLLAVREYLEERGQLLCCQGARPDVWPSGMLRQFGNGRQAYKRKAVFAFNGLPWQAE